MREQSFAALFRKSSLAHWNPKQPVKQSLSYKPATSTDPSNVDTTQRPPHYGLKYDPPTKLWGRPMKFVRIKGLDGPYGGMGLVEHCNLDPLRSALLRKLGSVETAEPEVENDPLGFPNDSLKASDSSNCNFNNTDDFLEPKQPTIIVEKRLPVLGRLLKRTTNGYTVNVVGVQALLPSMEIPRHCHFSMDDIVKKRVFKFFVKEYVLENGKPKVTLSFYEQ